MIKNYFTIAWRTLQRNQFFSWINMIGLAIGMTACLLLINYVTFETSFDSFHPQSENIYRVTHEFYQQGELKSQSAAVYSPLAPVMQHEMPDVQTVARIHPTSGTMTYEDGSKTQSFVENHIYFTDSTFFDIFSVQTIKGSRLPLQQPNTVVITEQMAVKYFGEEANPIGRSLHWHDGAQEAVFTISAVVKDMPVNSHLNFDFLLSFSTLERLEASSMLPLEENWGWPGFYTYLRVKSTVSIPVLETKINDAVDQRIGEQLKKWNNGGLRFYLQPLQDIHLHSRFSDELSPNGDISTVRFISIIAIIVLLIAYINYVNLTTARSLTRAREVGIRKLMGSQRWQLINQFVLESLLLNAFALLTGFLLYHLTLPLSHFFTNTPLPNVLWTSAYIIPMILFLLFVGPLLSSLYPALVLSNYKPATVLKGKFKHSSQGIVLRKGLVIVQYVASVAMIAGTLIVFEQVSYMRNKDLGVNLEQVLVLHGPTVTSAEENTASRIEAMKQTLLHQPAVSQVSITSAVPGTEVKNVSMYKRGQEEWENGSTIAAMKVDADFMDTYQAALLAGRNFSSDNQNDKQGKTLLMNEEATYLLGFTSPEAALQQKVVSAIGEEREVVGIIKNYHQHSVAQAYEPLLFVMDTSEKNYISVKLNPASFEGYNDLSNFLQTVETTYHQYYEGSAFAYFFLDDYFDHQYQAVIQFNRLFGFFSALALFVAGLGLFGLASYTTLQRTREIGIRKVLGASVSNILLLLSKDYIKLIVIAFVVAIPLANYFISDWLSHFAYRIEIQWWKFALPGLFVLLIALLSVIGQTMKAANTNPVDSLRNE